MYIDDLVLQMLDYDAEAEMLCMNPDCSNTYLVSEHRDLVCPECHRAPEQDICEMMTKDIILMKQIDHLRGNEPENTEPETETDQPEPERCDPPGLDDVIGNPGAVRQIRLALDAYRNRMDSRGEDDPEPVFPHVLFSGFGGTGKTMMSEIIAREVGKTIHLQMGQSLTNPARVGDVLLTLKPYDILFIDEIHGMKNVCQEALYRAMEDGMYVPVSKAGADVTKPVKLPPFTLIGATTDEWSCLSSFIQRFKYRIRMERLSPDEMSEAISERAERKGWPLDEVSALMIGRRSLGTPRIAVGLLDGCIDTAVAQDSDVITPDVVKDTCEVWGLDDLGLDRTERRYLEILNESPEEHVKLNMLSSKLDGLARRTLEIKIEPNLVWLGLIGKDKHGRYLTEKGKKHIMKGKYAVCQK